MSGIVVIVRTLNEHDNIERFCRSYTEADRILVADGGSTDDTIELAKKFPNVEVRDFGERTYLDNGLWRNCDSDHTNFLIAWSKEYSPDWVISDDCDISPNHLLCKDYKKILSECKYDYVMAVRLYLWDDYLHFPNMAKPGQLHNKWEASLWAWRGNQDLHAVNDNFPHFSFRVGDTPVTDFRKQFPTLELMPPHCLLHFSWVDHQKLERKLYQHRTSGSIKNMLHPLEFGGPLERIPNFAHL